MSIDPEQWPDYELDDVVQATTDQQLKALANQTRKQILDLVLERAASVAELAEAVGRPKSTMAHHVDVLTDAGLLKVVRTRKVRAVEERFYGRVGRTVWVVGDKTYDPENTLGDTLTPSFLHEAMAEIAPGTKVSSTLRHARISADQAEEFFERVLELANEFTRQPREGDTVYAFTVGLFPTDSPVLPNPSEADPSGEGDDQ